jgi:hypothetical protein
MAKAIAVGMVKTTGINVEHEVVGLFAKPDTIQVSAFLEQSIAQGVPVFGFPVGALAGVWMLGIDEIKPMWKEMQKRVWFLDCLELRGGKVHQRPSLPTATFCRTGLPLPSSSF